MNTKPLIETNPYLRNPKLRSELIERSAKTSFGVEGIDVTKLKDIHISIPTRGPKKIYQNQKISK